MSAESPIRVAVHGAVGRVGREVLRAVAAAPDLTIAAAIDRVPPDESPALPASVPYYSSVRDALAASPADVIVDFSLAQATLDMLPDALDLGARPVIGTTGFTPEQVVRIGSLCERRGFGGFLAPNFTIGAALLAKLAAIAAPYFEYADIVEEHHEMKADAPSGTALGLAQAIREARPERFARNEPEREPLAGTRGGDFHGVSVHAARMPGRMAHHQVTFGGPGQTLSLRHDTNDRECYMPGVLLAVRSAPSLPPGLTVGLAKLMNL